MREEAESASPRNVRCCAGFDVPWSQLASGYPTFLSFC